MIKGKKETFYALIFSVFSKVITYLLLLVFANFYAPEQYGLGSFAFNVRNIIMLFAFIGLPDALVPFIVRKKKVSGIFNLIALITGVLFIAGLGLMFYYSWIWPLVVTFPLIMMNSFAMSFWRAKSRHDVPFKIGLYAIGITLIFAFLLKDYGKLGVVSAYALGNLFSFIITVYPLRREIAKNIDFSEKIKFNRPEMKSYLSNGLTVTFIGSVFVFLAWMNSTLLGVLGNNFAQVAEFNVASALAGVIAIIPVALSMFMVTRASQIKDKEMSLKVLHRVTRVSFFTSLLASILLIIFAPIILKIFFSKYIGIQIYIAILAAGMVFFSSYYIIYSYHVGKLDSQKIIFPVILGVLINLIAALILIPQYNVLGISYASSIAHLSILLAISMKERMRRITLASLLAILILILTYMIGYYGLIIFVLIIPLALILKVITKEDIKVIMETLSQSFKK